MARRPRNAGPLRSGPVARFFEHLEEIARRKRRPSTPEAPALHDQEAPQDHRVLARALVGGCHSGGVEGHGARCPGAWGSACSPDLASRQRRPAKGSAAARPPRARGQAQARATPQSSQAPA
eukprot:12051896-Alexandrium_andersonii.AAC.1